jgi:hypothetical protein
VSGNTIHPYGEETALQVANLFTDDVGIGARRFVGNEGAHRPFLSLMPITPGAAEIPSVAGPVPEASPILHDRPCYQCSPLPDFLGSDGKMHNHNTFASRGGLRVKPGRGRCGFHRDQRLT